MLRKLLYLFIHILHDATIDNTHKLTQVQPVYI